MKHLIFSIILYSLNTFASSEMTGTWKFTEYIFEGETHSLPNPNLDLRFTFQDNGYSLLKWFRTDEVGFCERLGTYKTKDNLLLIQKTIWINPDNAVECANDLEMHVDYETTTPYKFVDGHLQLTLALNGEDFIYVFTLVESQAK